MSDTIERKVTDLPPDIHQAIGKLLGRELRADEMVSVTARQISPEEEKHVEAARGLLDFFERVDARRGDLPDIPEDELDALIEEAKDYVRHHPE